MGSGIATILTDIRRWVQSRPDLHGLALVGSHASGSARAESDIDLVIPTDDLEAYREADWVQSALDGRIVTRTDAE